MAKHKTLQHRSIKALATAPALGTACLIVIRGRSMGLMVELSADGPTLIGRDPDAVLTLDDMSVSRRHAMVEACAAGYVVSDLGSTNGIFLNGIRVRAQVLRNGDRIQVGASTILKFCFQDDLDLEYQRQIYDSATRDALTGVLNRRFFAEALDVDFVHAQRSGWGLSLLMMDIDHFKAVNDRLGHVSGDEVLTRTAKTVQETIRPEDLLARYGGEEFVVLLRFTDQRNAALIAERVRDVVAQQVFDEGDDEFRITISIGLATLIGVDPESPRELIERADAALYQAKTLGRNRVAVAREPGSFDTADDAAPAGSAKETTSKMKGVDPISLRAETEDGESS